MRVDKLTNYTRGWFIGHFEPSILKSEAFEVAVLTHKKDEFHAPHYHAIAIEYNVVVEGTIKVNGQILSIHDIFVFEQNEIATVEFLTDCRILCIKVPSIPNDKYIV